jgi:hypothetical protein
MTSRSRRSSDTTGRSGIASGCNTSRRMTRSRWPALSLSRERLRSAGRARSAQTTAGGRRADSRAAPSPRRTPRSRRVVPRDAPVA